MHRAVYLTALAVSITTFALSLTSLLQTHWIDFRTPQSSPISIHTTYGLFQKCTSSHLGWTDDGDGGSVTCRKFPTRSQDCSGGQEGRLGLELVERSVEDDGRRFRVGLAGAGKVESGGKRKRLEKEKDPDEDDEWGLCDSWITAGYSVQMSLIFGAAAILCTFIVTLGGRLKRESGWRVVAGLMTLHAACLIIATSLVAHEFNTNDRFYVGSHLDKSFIMATTAWALDVVVIFGLGLVGTVGLLREDEYTPIE